MTGSTDRNIQTGVPNNNPTNLDVFVIKLDSTGHCASTAANVCKSVYQLDSAQNSALGGTVTTSGSVKDVGFGVAADRDNGIFVAGATDWQFRNGENAGGMDSILAKYTDGCSANTSATGCTTGWGCGDPHYRTIDGRSYDFQGSGEFIEIESTTGNPFVIQARMAYNSQVTVHKAIATMVGADRVTINAEKTPPVRINGVSVNLAADRSIPLLGGRVYRQPDGSGYTIAWNSGERLVALTYGFYMNVYVTLPNTRSGVVRGLLGDFNNNLNDDFKMRDGTQLPTSLSFAQMYKDTPSYASSWRISQQESLFDYEPGESTATFTDVNLPSAPISYVNLTQEQKAYGQAICAGAGVTDPVVLENCIFDVGASGDPGLAQSSLDLQKLDEAQSPGAPAQKVVTEVYAGGFETSVDNVWTSGITSMTPAGDRSFLGEFTNEKVALSLDKLPTHTSVTVSFDLLILQGWDGNGPFGPSLWSMSEATAGTLINTTFSNTSSAQSYPGTYPSNNAPGSGAAQVSTMYYASGDSVYSMTLTFNHTTPTLAFDFEASNLAGITNEAWGLDNMQVQVQ